MIGQSTSWERWWQASGTVARSKATVIGSASLAWRRASQGSMGRSKATGTGRAELLSAGSTILGMMSSGTCISSSSSWIRVSLVLSARMARSASGSLASAMAFSVCWRR